MKDYSIYPIVNNVYLTGAEAKDMIIINNKKYIIKYQKNSEIGLVYNHISEFLGSHIFELLGIPVQDTYLGMYNGKQVVVIKHFCKKNEYLVPFNEVGDSSLEQNKEMYQYSYEDIEQMLIENTKSTNVQETINRFWDMFIVDALNGNFDRHGGNWGFVKENNKYRIAPVYDNGSCMYPKLNTDERIKIVLNDVEEINKRIYNFPTSHIKLNGKKSSYYDIINSLEFEECNNALIRIYPRINLELINNLIDSIEGISDLRKIFYKKMYFERYIKILKPAYDRLISKEV